MKKPSGTTLQYLVVEQGDHAVKP